MANTITLPNGLGNYYTYMNWNTVTNTSSNQYKLREQAFANGTAQYDSEGYARINGRYVVAMTSTFGNVGDYVDIQTANGKTINAVIGDIKSQEVTAWDSNPANTWGHNDGQVVVEYITNWGTHSNPTSDGGIISVTNLGKNYLGGDMVGATSSGILGNLKNKILYNIVIFCVVLFIIVVGVWFFAKAFDIDLKGVIL